MAVTPQNFIWGCMNTFCQIEYVSSDRRHQVIRAARLPWLIFYRPLSHDSIHRPGDGMTYLKRHRRSREIANRPQFLTVSRLVSGLPS
jgi:hypothetical protein